MRQSIKTDFRTELSPATDAADILIMDTIRWKSPSREHPAPKLGRVLSLGFSEHCLFEIVVRPASDGLCEVWINACFSTKLSGSMSILKVAGELTPYGPEFHQAVQDAKARCAVHYARFLARNHFQNYLSEPCLT